MYPLKLDLIMTTALAVLVLMGGAKIRQRIGFFERFCIPAPVIGGFGVSLLVLFLRETGIATVSFDTTLQGPFMVAFFTTVGIGGSLRLLRSGGSALIIYLVICWGIAIFQNTFGPFLAYLFGIDPVFGVMAGAVSLLGGHGAAAAFGPMAEQLGFQGAAAVALASATFGLIAGGLLGGPLATWLIRSHNVEIKSEAEQSGASLQAGRLMSVDSTTLTSSMGLILALMTLGILLTTPVQKAWDFVLPGYVGAMFAAILFRNLNDNFHFVKINQQAIDAIADIALGVFLTMAMMNLKIWELYKLALPLFGVLALQTAALAAIASFLVFRALGKNYDAAVMCSGLMGHGLGATPNAVANMSAFSQRYGVVSYKAFLIVPLCGAVLVDLVAIPFHTWMINYLR